MQTKTILAVVIVLIVAGVGYWAFTNNSVPATTEVPQDTASQGKLNINAICDGALAYMTFPSGAEADAFVKECKEGKHPEVVEQWKQQNGISDDRAI